MAELIAEGVLWEASGEPARRKAMIRVIGRGIAGTIKHYTLTFAMVTAIGYTSTPVLERISHGVDRSCQLTIVGGVREPIIVCDLARRH
jgi:hypothetical protein